MLSHRGRLGALDRPRARGFRGTRLLLVLAGLFVTAAVAAVPAGAKVVTDPVTHKKFGIVPTTKAGKSAPVTTACVADNTDCTALTYNGGPVQHSEKIYELFWTPSGHPLPSTYRSGLSNFVTELSAADYGTGNPVAVTQQYYDNTGAGSKHNFVSTAISNGGGLIDTDAYPASTCTDTDGVGNTMAVCLTAAQIQTEVESYVNAHHLPTGLGTEYFVFTPYNVGSCDAATSTSANCSYTGYCGWHTAASSSTTTYLFADMPWAYNVSGCDVNDAFGAGYPNADGIDPVVGIFSHELSETMTDPEPGSGWTQTGGTDAGYEIGDKCAYIYGAGGYGSTSGLSNNGLGYWNVNLGGDQYLLQLEYSNFNATCEKTDTQTQPSYTPTVTPNPPVHGSAATFKVVVTDAIGVAYVKWNFGDGTTATSSPYSTTSSTTVSVAHTYAAAGARTLTVIVTDEKGNEVKKTLTYTVS